MGLHWESFVYAIVAFGVLYVLLNKYAFGPLLGIMEERKRMLSEQITTTEENRRQSEQLLAEQKQALQAVRQESKEIIERAHKISAKQGEEIVDNAKDEATRLKNEAIKDIENEKNKAIVALRSQVSEMSVLIASKIMEKQIDETSQKQLIDHYLQEVGGNQ